MLRTLLLCFSTGLGSIAATAQESDFPYLFYADDTVAYQEITGGAVLNQNNPFWDDTTFAAISLGFSFEFGGRSFTKVTYHTNGYLSFDNNDSFQIRPFQTDLINLRYWNAAENSEIRVQTMGSSPNRRFVIQQKNAGFYDADDDSDYVNFQIQLEEGSNNFRIHFGTAYFTENLWIYAPRLQIGYQYYKENNFYSWHLYDKPRDPEHRKLLNEEDTLSRLRPLGDTLGMLRYTFEYTLNPIDTGQEFPPGFPEKNHLTPSLAEAWPNPFSGSLQIRFLEAADWELIDFYGQVLEQGNAMADALIQPDAARLSAGNYLLNIRKEDQVQIIRLVKY